MSHHESPPDISLLSGDFWGRNPHEELTWLRANSPVWWDENSNIWGIARYDHVKEIETNAAVFSNANGVRPEAGATPMLIDLDDPAHRRRRQLVAEGFTPRRVREQEPKVRRVVDRLIDQVCEAGECDFVWDLAAWLPLVMIGDALGVDPADHATLMTWSDDLLRGQGTSDPELLTKMIDAFSGYTDYANRVIEDRRGCPRDDLMSVLVHAEVDGEHLDDGALLFDSLLILIGGDETTRHVLSGGMEQLMAHPDQRQLPGDLEARCDRVDQGDAEYDEHGGEHEHRGEHRADRPPARVRFAVVPAEPEHCGRQPELEHDRGQRARGHDGLDLAEPGLADVLGPGVDRQKEDRDQLRDDPAQAVHERLAGELLQPGAHAGVLGSLLVGGRSAGRKSVPNSSRLLSGDCSHRTRGP